MDRRGGLILPYRQCAAVFDVSGNELGTIKLSVWQSADPRETPTGEVWNWTGEAEIEAAELLVDQSNRRLYVVDDASELDPKAETPPGKRLVVLAAVRHDYLPHLELRLSEGRGG